MSTLCRRSLCYLVLLAAPFLSTQPLYAAEVAEDFYVGLGFGVAQISEDVILIDDSSMAYKALFGYDLDANLGVEASFVTLDDYEAFSPFAVDTQTAVADGRGLNVAAVLKVPLTGRVELKASVGMLFWKTDAEVASIESSGSDLSFGLGVNFKINETLVMRLDFDTLNFGDVDANVGSAALVYRF